MTNDQKSLAEKEEVFLGPTTAETDEFYAFQRDNPGKEKAEYLQWFEGKFGKEIELRRRRSDQPSDLEYMVIKKRSKYRERIGIESEKLVTYYENNPKKTYLGALKRSRASEASADSPPDLNSNGPGSAKRGRRSYGSVGPMSSSASGPPPSSMPTFSVDISNNRPQPDGDMNASENQSRQMTPQVHSNEASVYPNSGGMRDDDGPRVIHGEPPKPGLIPLPSYPNRIHQPLAPAGSPGTPTHRDQPGMPLPPQTPMWAAVNNNAPFLPKVGAGKIAPKLERPSGAPLQPGREPPHPQQVSPPGPNPSPAARVLRSNSISKSGGPSAAPPVSLPSIGTGVPPPPSRMMPGPPPPPDPQSPEVRPRHPEQNQDDDMDLEDLRNRLAEAARKQAQFTSEVSGLEEQVRFYERQELLRQHEMDVRRFKGIEQGFVAERERLVSENLSVKAWNADLQRGNLELQDIKNRLESDIIRLVEERNHAIHALRHHEAKLYTITQAFDILGGSEACKRATASKYGPGITSPTEYDHRSHKDKEDLDSWVNKKFAIDASNEDQLKSLVTDLAKAGVSDFGSKLKNLEVFVNNISVEREKLQSEWTSRLFSPSRRESQTPEAEKSHGSYAASDKQTPPATATTAVTTPQERSPLQHQVKSSSKVKPDPSRPATPEEKTVRGNRSGDIEMRD
ncbi:hypothetical protein L873DRAFT_1729992 [Choiromyces venosus 120613-1]|uniref:Uncharacterized protein n=1 Tax=Choiromyces venosus 120613-1 TaxID=1336337 RepID=A0A3N4K1I1_9PEZI|nr:hypothetical protein L873DRAFT_1729992 [Choiromyces venosus 120613-1]